MKLVIEKTRNETFGGLPFELIFLVEQKIKSEKIALLTIRYASYDYVTFSILYFYVTFCHKQHFFYYAASSENQHFKVKFFFV